MRVLSWHVIRDPGRQGGEKKNKASARGPICFPEVVKERERIVVCYDNDDYNDCYDDGVSSRPFVTIRRRKVS